MSRFSDYIVFADESGSPTLDNPDPSYPIFVLAFLIVRKDEYYSSIVPDIQRLKFDYFGHDQVILHERDIRRQSGAFARFQANKKQRKDFLERINELVSISAFSLVIAVIDKVKLRLRYSEPWSPYDIALTFCMERTAAFLLKKDQAQRNVHVIFEARGAAEDRALDLQFYRISTGNYPLARGKEENQSIYWSALFADKKSNSAGLQLADLVARPAGLKILRPSQRNRAYECFQSKLFRKEIKCFP